MSSDSPDRETDWTAIYQRIQSGEYEVAARILLDLQLGSLQAGDSTSAAGAAAARQICLALVSYRAEVEWHQLAQGNAELRQRALIQNLLSLLSLVGDARVTSVGETAQATRPETDHPDHVNIWQRLQHLLERQRPGDPAMDKESSADEEKEAESQSSRPAPSGEHMPEEAADESTPVPSSAAVEKTELSEPDPLEAQQPIDPAATGEESDAEIPSSHMEITAETPPVAEPGEDDTVIPIQPPTNFEEEVDSEAARQKTVATVPPDLRSSDDEPPDLAIYCLGSFRILQHGKLIEHWNGLKGLSVIKYLVAHRGTPVSKDVLMDVFWPDADLDAARRNLHQAIYSLRQALRRHDPDIQHIRFENNQYLLNPRLTVWVDVDEFEERVQHGRALEFAGRLGEALVEYGIADSLYQGAFLEEDVYEDWPSARREYLRNTYLEIADRVSKHYLQQSAYAASIGLCQKILGQDPCYENAHRRLMRCYRAQGQRNLAIRQYQMCVQTLREELDVPPSDETANLYQEIMGSEP